MKEPGACCDKEPSRIGFRGSLAGFKALGTSQSACRHQQLPVIEFCGSVARVMALRTNRFACRDQPARVIKFGGSITRFNAVGKGVSWQRAPGSGFGRSVVRLEALRMNLCWCDG